MHKLAGYALFSGPMNAAGVSARYEAVKNLVTTWLAGKGTTKLVDGQEAFVLNDGRIATVTSADWTSEEGRVHDVTLTEPTDAATLRTQVSVGAFADQVVVYVEMKAAGDAYHFGPLRLNVHRPYVVPNIVSAFEDWQVGEVPLRDKPLELSGASDGRLLEDVIWHPRRNLPVVVLSPYEGRYLTDGLPKEMASDLLGVALVATVDSQAAGEVTSRRGQEWSCFNGAVRLYWPGLTPDSRPIQNPLWTRESILAKQPTPEAAASRLKRQLRKLLLGLSAFAVPEPPQLATVRKAHLDRASESQRKSLLDDNDWEGLANSYSEENSQLKQERDDLANRTRELEAEVASLQLALQWREPDVSEIEPDAAFQPATLMEAVEEAKATLGDELVFGDDVDAAAKGVAADAGPPDKVLLYLQRLAEMVRARRKGTLGTTATKWLMDRGVIVSGESLTIKNSADEQRRRTWHDGAGRRAFDLHLKPTDATHPDRCVRIYFEYDEKQGKALVGWVGRHP